MAKLQGAQSTYASTNADVSEAEMTDDKLAEIMRPKNEADFAVILKKWLRGFHKRHLKDLEDNLNKIQAKLFIVKWKDTREKLGCDIEGEMTESILNASRILEGKNYKEEAKAPKIPLGEQKVQDDKEKFVDFKGLE